MLPFDPSLKFLNPIYDCRNNLIILQGNEDYEDFENRFVLKANHIYNPYEEHEESVWGLPVEAQIIICNNCDGHGSHLRTSMRDIAYTSDDIAEDPEFFDEMRSGHYDEQCKICNGTGRLMSTNDPVIQTEINNHLEMMNEIYAEERAERKYFGDYY